MRLGNSQQSTLQLLLVQKPPFIHVRETENLTHVYAHVISIGTCTLHILITHVIAEHWRNHFTATATSSKPHLTETNNSLYNPTQLLDFVPSQRTRRFFSKYIANSHIHALIFFPAIPFDFNNDNLVADNAIGANPHTLTAFFAPNITLPTH